MMTGKREVREGALRQRRAIPQEKVKMLSRAVEVNVTSLLEFSDASTIAAYVAKPDEVQTAGILMEAISRGKRVIVPRADPSSRKMTFHQVDSLGDLRRGTFGVLEPPPQADAVPLSESQLVLVPVVAWDEGGQRLGYGKGYFDRELKSRGMAVSTGLAFESQRRGRLPSSPYDVRLDMLVTERGVRRFRRVTRAG
ncbi:MAG: 5-formyltetrahydrofolate cyclo-ligase [Thaumarchaeota archaeon]|nr:5-formyltetrahydrofolate cyclo-ligase [Nitrososphaerota archaeon]